MKKIYLLGVLALLVSGPAFAQEYQPSDTWPFIYEEFQQGTTRSLNGGALVEARFNVDIIAGSLFFIGPDEKIMTPDMNTVYAAKIGEDTYVNIRGKMYKLLSQLDLGSVVEGISVDEDAMNKTDIGYGAKSSSASSYGMTVLMDGRSSLVNKTLLSAEDAKYKGTPLAQMVTDYFYIDGKLIKASRQEVSSYPGVDKKAAATFFKEEKIKWKETASLEKVLVFLHSQISK